MSTPVLVSAAEYLSTVYRPDCDYVDGDILERNVGEKDHSMFQGELLTWLNVRRQSLGIRALVEQRLRVSATRYRIPDICVYLGREPDEQVFSTPPFICVEILSPRDTLTSLRDRIDDYLAFGVPHVWLVDPTARRAWACSEAGFLEVRDLNLRSAGPEIVIPLAEVFAALD